MNTSKSLLLIFYYCLLIFSALSLSAANATPAALDNFPLHKGSYWTYQGKARLTRVDSSSSVEVDTVAVKIRRTVFATMQLPQGAYIAWLKETPVYPIAHGYFPPNYFAYFINGAKVYEIEHGYPALRDVERNPEGVLKQLRERVRKDEYTGPDFIFPLHDKQALSSPLSTWRGDTMYQWYVEKDRPVRLAKKLRSQVFKLTYLTCPDETNRWFIPGIGITRMKYEHHGTIIEWDLKLVRYHIARDVR